MAKKFGKFILCTAAIGAAATAYYYLHKKDEELKAKEEDFDYDDFSEHSNEAPASSSRTYVSLQRDEEDFTPLKEVAKDPSDIIDESTETIEEFFNENEEEEFEPENVELSEELPLENEP